MATLTAKQTEVVKAIQAAFDMFSETGSMEGYKAAFSIANMKPAFHALRQRGILEVIDTNAGRPVWYVHFSKIA